MVWTEEKVRLLKEGYASKINADLAKELGVSKSAVEHKAIELKLRKPPGFQHQHKDEIYPKRQYVRNPGWFKKGNRYSEEFWFNGERLPEEKEAERVAKMTKTRRKQIYDELMRIKYGLRRQTRLNLRDKVYYIDRKKYIEDEDD